MTYSSDDGQGVGGRSKSLSCGRLTLLSAATMSSPTGLRRLVLPVNAFRGDDSLAISFKITDKALLLPGEAPVRTDKTWAKVDGSCSLKRDEQTNKQKDIQGLSKKYLHDIMVRNRYMMKTIKRILNIIRNQSKIL